MGLQDLSPNSLDNGKVSSLKRPRCSNYDSDSDEAIRVSGNGPKRHDLMIMEEEDLIRELDDLVDHEDEGPRSSTTGEYDDLFILDALIGESDILRDPAAAHETVLVPHEVEVEEEGLRIADERECDDDDDDDDDDEGLITDFFNHIGGADDADLINYLSSPIHRHHYYHNHPEEEVQVATGQVASTGLVALSYVQKVSDKVSLVSNFMYNYMSRDVTASFGYEYILRQCRLRGKIGSNGTVAVFLEERQNMGHNFVLSAEIDHRKRLQIRVWIDCRGVKCCFIIRASKIFSLYFSIRVELEIPVYLISGTLSQWRHQLSQF